MKSKTLLVIGATSGMAEECARLWLASGDISRVVLVARSASKLERVSQDLKVRAPQVQIEPRVFDQFNEAHAISDLVTEISTQGAIDIALVAHGTLPEQSDCESDLGVASAAMLINGVSPALFSEAIAAKMQAQTTGTLVVIGSVAGDKGRKSNYTYGAAKGLVTRYVQGLQHRFADSGVNIVLVKPGPTATPMTAHLAGSMKMASVESVAKAIVDGSSKGKKVIYAPAKWALIMLIIRHLPDFIFNKMDI